MKVNVIKGETMPRGRQCSLSKNEFTTARFGGYTGRDDGSAKGKQGQRLGACLVYEEFGSELLVVTRCG